MSRGRSADPRPSAQRVLVVTDRSLAALVALCLNHCGLVAGLAPNGQGIGRVGDVSIVLLEVGDAASEELLRRAALTGAGTIALVDLERRYSSLAAFAAGADAVIRVPFTPDELVVRAASLLRRMGSPVTVERRQPVGRLVLDLDESFHVDARTVRIGAAANSLLYVLVAQAGDRITRDDVRRLAWGLDRRTSDAAVNESVRSLARSLGEDVGTISSTQEGLSLALRASVA